MNDQIPAETLRAAANKLKALATAASPGAWTVDDPTYPAAIYGADGRDIVSGSRWGGEARVFDEDADATYIGLMHPGVGTALADWLDATAKEMDGVVGTEYEAHGSDCDFGSWQAALAVARAILGSPQ